MRVDCTTYERAARQIVAWGASGDSRYVCAASVNNVMEARDDPAFRRIINDADLVTPDGMPLVWGLQLLGIPRATRVYGPDLTSVVCAHAARCGVPVGFYGGTPEVLDDLIVELRRRLPGLSVAYRSSPPFRPLTEDEDARIDLEVDASGARILFVGLGCPKQERWMAAHRGRTPAVMIGVGAAFDFISGHKRQAPRWMMRFGLEWLYRLVSEPRRLWRRYLGRNPRFAALFALQVVRARLVSRRSTEGPE